MRNLRIKNIVGFIAFGFCLCLGVSAQAWAGSIGVGCSFESWPGGARSKIKITSRVPKGRYFAIVLSGDGMKKKTRTKTTSGRKQLEFEFDSDLEDIVSERKTQIDPQFNKSLRFTAQIRANGTNRLIADTRSYRPCDKIEEDGDNGTPPSPEPPPPSPPPCRLDDNPSPGDPNDCSGGGSGSGGGRNRGSGS